jgi:hypothetical protein
MILPGSELELGRADVDTTGGFGGKFVLSAMFGRRCVPELEDDEITGNGGVPIVAFVDVGRAAIIFGIAVAKSFAINGVGKIIVV